MIGVMDSGVGGLQAVSVLHRRFPQEDILYFADTAHLPYGEKDVPTLKRLAREAIFQLRQDAPRAILIACGTLSATVLSALQAEVTTPLYGIIDPTVQAIACRFPQATRIGVIATRATVATDAYRVALRRVLPQAHVCSVACPDFVPFLEGLSNVKDLTPTIRKALAPLCTFAPQVLILGCTHFPLLSQAIAHVLPRTILCDAGALAAQSFPVAPMPIGESGRVKMLVSGDAASFSARIFACGLSEFYFTPCKTCSFP